MGACSMAQPSPAACRRPSRAGFTPACRCVRVAPQATEASMLQEFKEFALKGNVVDLAVGVIIGAAFGRIVDSLVNDIIMPIIGAVTGGLDFSNMFFML